MEIQDLRNLVKEKEVIEFIDDVFHSQKILKDRDMALERYERTSIITVISISIPICTLLLSFLIKLEIINFLLVLLIYIGIVLPILFHIKEKHYWAVWGKYHRLHFYEYEIDKINQILVNYTEDKEYPVIYSDDSSKILLPNNRYIKTNYYMKKNKKAIQKNNVIIKRTTPMFYKLSEFNEDIICLKEKKSWYILDKTTCKETRILIK